MALWIPNMRSVPRPLPALLLVALAPGLAGGPARADELAAAGTAHGIVIHAAAATLRDYCSADDRGRLWLTLPGGARYELVTSVTDPAIANPGDGTFHPFDAAEVRDALAATRFPLGAIAADVFILPYPRRVQCGSAAGPSLILLSPGVRPLSREHQHAEFVHELGHVVQYALMPDGDARWSAYDGLRAIADPARYSASSPHADRPHEIFAEDFRSLFGDAAATYSGTIENEALTPPGEVPGLDTFLLGLAGGPAAIEFAAHPNPSHGPLTLTLNHAVPVPLDLFDATGRRIASLAPRQVRDGVEWSFGGIGPSGRAVRGVLFARPRGIPGRGTRVVLLP